MATVPPIRLRRSRVQSFNVKKLCRPADFLPNSGARSRGLFLEVGQ
jgi:hypothetical protein